MALRRGICALALFLALAPVFCPTPGPAAAASLDEAYKTAHDEFTNLLKDEKKAKYRVYWQELEIRFSAIYTAAPHGQNAAKALYFAARTNDELARQSLLKSDFRKAVDYYARVVARFPNHNLADDALVRKAAIEAEFLQNREQATADAKRVLADYPKSSSAGKAQELLRSFDGKAATSSTPPTSEVAATRSARASSPRTHETEAAQAKPEPHPQIEVTQARGEKIAPGGLNRLREVRHQASDEYSRVVLDFDGPVSYRYELLRPDKDKSRPHRLYIDLADTVLGAKAKREVTIADGILRQVRLAQNTLRVARVVLDFDSLQKYQIFALENPYRLIVDVSTAKAATKPGQVKAPEPAAAQETPSRQRMPAKIATAEPAKKPASVSATNEPELDPLDDLSNKVASNDPTLVAVKKDQSKEKPKAKAPAYKPTPEGRKQSGSLVEQLGLTVRTIMIDPGHGGKDPGASGVGGLSEKNVNLKLALALGRHLEEKGFRVLYTRTTDKFVPLEDRTAKANVQKADLLISVHCNSFGNKSMHGLETYYLDLANSKDAVRVAARENAVTDRSISDLQVILTDLMLNSKLKESKDLARNIHARVVKAAKPKYNLRDHGVHSAPFYVLMGAKMPAVLLEVGYITNPAEAERLSSPNYLDHLAAGLAQGVLAYKKSIERLASL